MSIFLGTAARSINPPVGMLMVGYGNGRANTGVAIDLNARATLPGDLAWGQRAGLGRGVGRAHVRTRGSSTPYSRLAARFAKMTAADATRNVPWSTQ